MIEDVSDRVLDGIDVKKSGTRVVIRENTSYRLAGFAIITASVVAFFGGFILLIPDVDMIGKILIVAIGFFVCAIFGTIMLPWNGRIVLELETELCTVEWRFLWYAFNKRIASSRHSILTGGVAEERLAIEETGAAGLFARLVVGIPITHAAKQLVPALISRDRDGATRVLVRFREVELLERVLDELGSMGGGFVSRDLGPTAQIEAHGVQLISASIPESIPEPDAFAFNKKGPDLGDPAAVRRAMMIFYIGLAVTLALVAAALTY